MMMAKLARWRETKQGKFLLLAVFTTSFIASVLLSKSLLPFYLETVAGLRSEGNTIHFTPRHTFNGIQEWGPRNTTFGLQTEWGISVRSDTPAEMKTIWHDRDGNGEFDWMEVTVSLGGNLHGKIELDPTGAISPVDIACSTGDRVLEHRDIDGDGNFDMLLERIVENGEERLIRASVPFNAARYEVFMAEPFDNDVCTIVLPDSKVKRLVFVDGLWEPQAETGVGGHQ